MHNNLPDETQLPNGQKFELLSLALLGVPSMAEKFLEVSNTLKQLSFDPADYVCLKFILLLNQGKKKSGWDFIGNLDKKIINCHLPIFQPRLGTWTTVHMFKSQVNKSTKS